MQAITIPRLAIFDVCEDLAQEYHSFDTATQGAIGSLAIRLQGRSRNELRHLEQCERCLDLNIRKPLTPRKAQYAALQYINCVVDLGDAAGRPPDLTWLPELLQILLEQKL